MIQSQTLHDAGCDSAYGTRPLAVWLWVVAALVFLLVGVGGATRLTGSGLSITEWRPIMGALPPLSHADWLDAFAKYQQIPQYEHVNRGMSLDAFKHIFWWEWSHRFLGRAVGVAFLLPFLYFLAMRRIPRRMAGRLAGILALGALQGAAGWYMVSSGLVDRISVSQYRLALHLGLAILILGALIWTALSLDEANRLSPRSAWSASASGAGGILALVFLQVLLGALVAGLKAGSGYNTWPLMHGQLVPGGLMAMEPWYLNLFENALTVQFNHRIAAYLLLIAVGWHAWRLRTPRATLLAAAVLVQAAVGIWTLLAQVPLSLGLVHQTGAAAVFALAVWHLHGQRYTQSRRS
jgi:cytochrome c oxidase assembly protein subunit 15